MKDSPDDLGSIGKTPPLLARINRVVRKEYKRLGAYSLVGIVNTLIDFAILNVLHFHLGWSLIAANLFSTSVAMIFSFFANRHLVFKAKNKQAVWRQAMLFWVVTAFGLYVLQTSIIWVCSHPLESITNDVARLIHDIVPFSTAFIIANGIKALATVVSLCWNYVLYKKVVFVDSPDKPVGSFVE